MKPWSSGPGSALAPSSTALVVSCLTISVESQPSEITASLVPLVKIGLLIILVKLSC